MNYRKEIALTSLVTVFTFAPAVYAVPPDHAKSGGKKTTQYLAIPATGQTTCYDFETNLEEPCVLEEHLSQDGNLQLGEVLPIPRFTKNVNPDDDNGSGLTTPQSLLKSNSRIAWLASIMRPFGHNRVRIAELNQSSYRCFDQKGPSVYSS